MEPLVFESLKPIEIPVVLEGVNYVLREATESAASQYKNAQLKAMKLQESADGNKTSSFDGVAETEALLVSLCLFEKTDNGGERTVPLQKVKTWVHRVVEPLFQKAEEISNLKTKETKEEITKKIKELQGKLRKLNNENATGETDEKNS